MKLEIENDYRQKVMAMAFASPTTIDSKTALNAWKQAWLGELSSWHSPYKLLLNCENLQLTPYEGIEQDLELFFKFFKGAFLRKIVAYNLAPLTEDLLPVEVAPNLAVAAEKIGIRTRKQPSGVSDFRSQIHLENDFRAHVMELSFSTETHIGSEEELAVLKSKITNNLMQWHSKWNLLVDCTRLSIAAELENSFIKMAQHFSGLFMLTVIGYSPKSPKDLYPFKVYRSRHKAVTHLERVGALSGNEAHCQSSGKRD